MELDYAVKWVIVRGGRARNSDVTTTITQAWAESYCGGHKHDRKASLDGGRQVVDLAYCVYLLTHLIWHRLYSFVFFVRGSFIERHCQ
jgi:hypothetical protein